MRYLLVLLSLPFLFSCKKETTGNGQSINSVSAASLLDISYGSSASQKMDIYLPANRSTDSAPVILLVHGGGWTEGDKSDFSSSIPVLQTQLPRYAIININYRLAAAGQNQFPTQENDVKAAASFVFAKRQEYLISDKWVFLGASAGGHLALLQSYKYSSPVKPQAVVSFFGPTDLTAFYNSNPLFALQLQNIVGSTPALNPAIYQQSSPINFVTAQSPPTLLLQGGADPLVPVSQSTALRDKLQSLSVPNQYVFYPNDGHGWAGPDLLDSYAKITAFLHLYVH